MKEIQAFPQPDRSTQNACIENFNGKFRKEGLNTIGLRVCVKCAYSLSRGV
ncbi:transposase [Pusillimonas sp. ANT_WB101]|nr:transposase [Pusillimonas sp. ANT_WB101]